ncbi:unnamed protein product [Parnassius mnemosyne]|uniref:Apolipoprotein D n=1 Tax=Parnassius mnemosyne TaxID=213953 RepID=A0AAV1KNY9_9NEOP
MTKGIFIAIFSLSGLLGLSSAQLIQFGQCNPNIELQENFNLTRFLGTWYGIARTDNEQQNGDCATLELNRGNNVINVTNESVNNNFYQLITGTATHEQGTAKFRLNVSEVQRPIDFWVLLTDYDNFAVAYSCENRGNVQRAVYLWQLGRETTYPTEMMEALVNTTMNTLLGINSSDLRRIEHSENACYVLPEIARNEPVILPGQCNPNMTVVTNFNAARFQGVWHEIAKYYTINQAGTCNRAQYTLVGGEVNVVNSQVVNQTLETISGKAIVTSTDGSARLKVTLEVAPNVFSDSELWILGTDYDNYAISYTCVNLANNQKRVYSWILSRSRQLSATSQVAVNELIKSEIDLNERFYTETDQTDTGCFFFPNPVPGQPVVFRKRCDMSIPAMPAFDPERYMGLWHDIESYPSVFQGGSCNNAFYTLTDSSVLVYNTQVINQRLDTINGVAVPVATDGSAKLEVTFPIAGTNLTVTTDYWVLGTDYVSYSFVYTCININEEESQVYGWKLSRTKQMPAAGNTAINAIMNTIPVLDQRYFVAKDQSREGCFYYPEPQPDVPVVFPGPCDENIEVVRNFNLQQFQGMWYEIQAYPKEQQTGQCISHNYTSGAGNTLSLTSSSITDQFLGITNGVLSFSSTDSSAKMTITITSSNGVITIPFWILSTDYNNYAFAYSCVNQGSDFRKVFSWKLSRSKQLSSAANTTINNIINNNVVLRDEYYKDIDQSNRGCFYLPDLAPGEPVILPGQCEPNIQVVQNFNLTRYAGRWRLIESYPLESQTGTCNDATYRINNNLVEVFNTQVINQQLDTMNGTARVTSTDGSAKLQITFPGIATTLDYWVLDTDYDSYALVYSCSNINSQQRRVLSWKLSRTRDLTPTAINNINQVINNVDVLNNRFYEIINQSDDGCFYYPEPDGNIVTFRGQCDPNIRVVTGFDAQRYMNLWHDIESYPNPYQGGTCSNAFYEIVGGAVEVYNTQVINQRLDTIRGIATLQESNDASAKLTVTFPVAGTNLNISTDYWVLATDYTSYALVYSCRNIDNEHRQVYGWKISRTKQLTPQAITAINSVVNTIPVLDQRYFKIQDQSPTGCFYYPEPALDKPVVFPGQCDDSIQAVSNFNLNQFQGTWYEIQAYPKDQQSGQCVYHQYSTSSNALNLQSFNVLNDTLRLSNSVVTINSTDSSGRLLIKLTQGNQQIEIPFWILSTDYNNYALAYSCVNQGSDFRAVYSWKLSRTKQLSAAANTAINNAIQTITVLDNMYYQNIDQSEEACFYLPDIPPGQSVVFTGQCDPNIRVVQNFDPVRYMGRWRMIETYPSDFQSGSCNEANYRLLPDLTVEVYNTQVVNQDLDTINGSAILATTDGSAKLLVTFPGAPQQSDYWILDTDYDNYALVYSCQNINNQQRRVWSWKLSRAKQLSATATNNINQIVNRINVLNSRYYINIDHSDTACFYFPSVAPNTPVVYRGQCDPNIPVVRNFNLAQYLGLWHDIESYPSRFQFGTCSNAYYTLNGSVVDVFNTQVVNQSLATIDGVATLVSDPENSAKIVVTFPVAGTNLTTSTDYWVLSTDYTSYALVYSCTNLDEETRQVGSWKLSRTKQLTSNAVTAINNVIRTIPILDDRYYQQVDQSPEGCFYFPEPKPGEPVLFPGQCEDSIQAVPNFNMNQFLGTWHEIQAYPKDQQTGQCVNHQYTLATSDTLNLQSFNVLDKTLRISNSTVRRTSTDSSGKLLITLREGANAIEIPFWILSTDYNNYALAYSCVNRGRDFRAIYSWKLSRTKQLSAAANTAINNAIANITVLDNMYYENIDQSDNACFYLPEVSPGEPVDFPGRCDPNISVVQNFNLTRYAGRWRQIESYSSNSESGSCNQATNTIRPNGTIEVVNTEVVNQALFTITGSAVLATTDNSGKLLVTIPGEPEPMEYWILDTDYDTYAFTYSCRNINSETRRVWSWKLSRTRQLSTTAVTNINRIINNINVLDQRYYRNIDHSDSGCFYYPTPVPGASVVFPGQCDESIPVVRNFNASQYMGVWYDIESYPQQFQDGTCATATYTLTPNGVDVFNTQVINQQLDTITATAVPASNDGSAKLIVTFPIAGTNATISTPYWVLATDYSSYALVYSCSNVNDESRRVTSWKLSRQRSLTQAANQAINNVMSTIPVLRQQYYNERGHTEEDCFYYPNNNGGPVILNGVCEEQAAVTRFNTRAFAGTWYETARFPSELQTGQCAANQFTIRGQNGYDISNTIVNNERLTTLTGTATVSANGRGILNAKLSTGAGVSIDATIYVLATDYTNYALMFSCRNLGNQRKQIYSWKLSRSQSGLSQLANNIINEVVTNTTDLFDGYYDNSDQSSDACFYYPVFDSLPSMITLPGKCDETIRAKANFDASAYLGRWIEIARYPQLYQFGECSRAQYNLVNGSVEVVNTEVINNTLDTMIGSAFVASNDGSGILNVTFVLANGVVNVANYYILETDYISYSLVYSCRNLPDGNRQVSSWKLSRTRTLSNQANNIMNNIISNTRGLLEEYYITSDQSDETCFYVPEVIPDQAPVFRGQCEDISGVQGFDIQRYLGWWHEIERYPSDENLGHCISSEFRQSNNQYQVIDTNIFDVTAQVNTSTLTVTNNGRLRKTLSNGRVIDIWVLATDYETYSLLYSCENINEEYRRVWSAKHSKSRQLTQAAQNAMAPIITSNRVLYPQFYQTVDQSDSACFHYPEQTGRQIILPGQCAMDIPVVQNFDATQYTGTWYQIERYPQFHETGSCTGARYTLDETTGVVTLLNWEVIDGELDTIEGTATINSTDGSAKLLVTLPDRLSDDPEATVTTTLYVLTTDYVSYSLAYSCVNINQFQRSVGVWKLSRTRTMPEAGNTAINTYMRMREELYQPYFIQVEQSDECEEPSSAILFKSSIIVMLMCIAVQIFIY